MDEHPNDLTLCKARIAHETVLTNFDGRRRWLWIWLPAYLLFFLFSLVTLRPNFALRELVSGLQLWAVIYFVAVSIPVFGAMWGARYRPIEMYRKVKDDFSSYFEQEEHARSLKPQDVTRNS